MAKAKDAAIVRSLKNGQYDGLPDSFTKRDALRLVVKEQISEDVFDKYVDHLINESKRDYFQRPNGLNMKVGEKNWISLSGGCLGVAFNRPVVGKGNTILALLTTHREEILEFIRKESEGDYSIETRTSKKGSYNVLIKGNVVIGSAETDEKTEQAKGLFEEMLAS